MSVKINGQRLLDDLDDLAKIGRTNQGGLSRLAMSAADIEGRLWFQQRVQADGLVFRTDGAGNISAVLPSAGQVDAPTLLIGSHLDTVQNGGRFDGALGVLAGLEVLRTCRDAGLALPFQLEVISFTDEEGHILPLMGSRAAAGILTRTELEHPRGGKQALEAGMKRLAITPETILAARRSNLHAYLELHIEQGSMLEDAGFNIGIVTSMVGLRSYWLHFTGVSAHAGTKPMEQRADALWGASEFIRSARDLVMQHFAPGVMNVGQLLMPPGAFNIVPADVKLALEFRHSTHDLLDAMDAKLLVLAQQIASQFNLTLAIEPVAQVAPAMMDATLMQQLEAAADQLGLTHTRLFSFAGHDAQSMRACVPTAMLFVPSVKGISHHPDEFTHPEAVINGANLLLQTIRNLSENQPG
jgi:beta-ureidopropionase / N-carbamoyl-L-amino-acid hydrolase